MEKYTPEPAKARLKHDIKTTKIIPLQKLQNRLRTLNEIQEA